MNHAHLIKHEPVTQHLKLIWRNMMAHNCVSSQYTIKMHAESLGLCTFNNTHIILISVHTQIHLYAYKPQGVSSLKQQVFTFLLGLSNFRSSPEALWHKKTDRHPGMTLRTRAHTHTHRERVKRQVDSNPGILYISTDYLEDEKQVLWFRQLTF